MPRNTRPVHAPACTLHCQEFYPASIDNLARERALFDGPGPILLSGVKETDLILLLSGSDRSTSQVM